MSHPFASPVLVEAVSKQYPPRPGRAPLLAVQEVTFQVAPGEVLALLGPNGAGKTTTIKMIAGLLRPTAGRITLSGVDVATDRSRAVSTLGAVLEGNRNLHWKLTVRENLAYFGALKGVRDVRRRSDQLVDQLDLGSHVTKRVGELSRGLQQRVAIAIALLGDPRVLLLDEPTLGLDVLAGRQFQQSVKAIARSGAAIILTTHQMEVAQALSDRVAIISGGRLATLDSLGQLLEAHRTPGYEIRFRGVVPAPLLEAFAGRGVAPLEADETGLTGLSVPEGHPEWLYEVLDGLRAERLELVRVQQQAVDLEEVYRRIVKEHP
jgi:ABC-2 type transport system ATP-binding protein